MKIQKAWNLFLGSRATWGLVSLDLEEASHGLSSLLRRRSHLPGVGFGRSHSEAVFASVWHFTN